MSELVTKIESVNKEDRNVGLAGGGSDMSTETQVKVFIDTSAADLNEDQKRIVSTAEKWVRLMLAKNADYGSSVWEVPVLAQNMSTGDAILVRMSDKINRLQNLSKSGSIQVTSETIEDTISDLGAYCLLFLARPDAPSE